MKEKKIRNIIRECIIEVLKEQEKWIQKANLKKGALHRDLGIKQGEKIPMSVINSKLAMLKRKAKGDKKLSAKDQRLRRRLQFAKNVRNESLDNVKES